MTDLRNRIYTAISKPACDRCQSRVDWHPTDCEKHKCHELYEQETDAVLLIVQRAALESAMIETMEEYLMNSVSVTMDYRMLIDRAAASDIQLSEEEAVKLLGKWGRDITYNMSKVGTEMIDHIVNRYDKERNLKQSDRGK